MKKILIFTAGFGEGHNTAARNVRDAVEHIAPDEAKVEVLDLFDSCYGKLNDWVQKRISPRLTAHLAFGERSTMSLMGPSSWNPTWRFWRR